MPDAVSPVSDIPSPVTSMHYPAAATSSATPDERPFLRQLTPQRGVLGNEVSAVSVRPRPPP